MKFLRSLALIVSMAALSSCAGVINVQPQVNGLAVAGRFDQALKVLDNPYAYGKNNQLLYWLDKAMVLHYAGRYKESISAFESAKLEYDRLYTESISKISASWLWNDYALPYRGEDFERVMVNVFEAMNFAVLGDIEGALVEARNVDSLLNAINQQYDVKHKNVYRDDAFTQFLMGILYETDGNLNDALIAYRHAWKVYERDYQKRYATATPQILKENLLAAAEEFGDFDLAFYRREFADVKPLSWQEKKRKSEIIVIEYAGLSPLKLPSQVPVPLPDGYVSQITFPQYQTRTKYSGSTTITAQESSLGRFYSHDSALGQNIEAIAIKNLNDRKIRVMAKAVLRPAGKYIIERGIEYSLRKDHGKGTANVMQWVGSLYNMASERPDLRSWQTLPAQIRIARLIVEPGVYEIRAGRENLGKANLQAGEKKFFIMRSVQ